MQYTSSILRQNEDLGKRVLGGGGTCVVDDGRCLTLASL